MLIKLNLLFEDLNFVKGCNFFFDLYLAIFKWNSMVIILSDYIYIFFIFFSLGFPLLNIKN